MWNMTAVERDGDSKLPKTSNMSGCGPSGDSALLMRVKVLGGHTAVQALRNGLISPVRLLCRVRVWPRQHGGVRASLPATSDGLRPYI